MANPVPYCIGCRKTGHWLSECPDRVDVRQESLTKAKKKWIKPEIRRYVRVESLTGEPFVKLEEVARFNKKEYQRDYMKRKRDVEKANRVG
jgi:hypothetical protein